jgi:hypothetical protein
MSSLAESSQSAAADRVLSAQEHAIESGNTVVHGTVTDRVLRLNDAIRAYGPPRVTLDRAVLFTESFQRDRKPAAGAALGQGA